MIFSLQQFGWSVLHMDHGVMCNLGLGQAKLTYTFATMAEDWPVEMFSQWANCFD